jgi:TPR repeat protein
MYYNGEGVVQNHEQASYYHKLAGNKIIQEK